MAPHPRPGATPFSPGEDINVERFVDPFIGTQPVATPTLPAGDKGGSVFPGATVPFGMIQWSPDTGPDAAYGYNYKDTHITGFSVTHLSGAGCAALLDFPFLPTVAVPLTSPANDQAGQRDKSVHLASFTHADEVATPGYYAVRLRSGVGVRLTARARAGFAQITYPVGSSAGLLIEAGKSADDGDTRVTDGDIHLVGPNRVTASLSSADFCGSKSAYRVHMVADFDHPVAEVSAYRHDQWKPGARDLAGPRAGLYVRFDIKDSATVGVNVAISYVSVANAIANLEASTEDTGFEAVRAEAARAWSQVLGRVEVAGGSDTDKHKIYTALYHALLHPNVFSDVNGAYMGFDNQVHTAVGYTHYAHVSAWDAYRSWIQLISLLAPREASDVVHSLLADAEQCGGLPR